MHVARTSIFCSILFAGIALVATACTIPLPQPPMWVLDQGMQGGKDVYLIGVELGPLFEPDVETGTTCACGLQFSSPLPFGSDVTDAFVAVTNRDTHDMVVLPEFDFEPNNATESGLEDFTSNPQTEEFFDWYGLATTAITSINQPTLGPNEALKLWYRVEVDEFFDESAQGNVAASHVAFDPDEIFSPDNLTFAAGSAESDGTPIFDPGNHPVILFQAVAIPEPATIILALFAGLGINWRIRR